MLRHPSNFLCSSCSWVHTGNRDTLHQVHAANGEVFSSHFPVCTSPESARMGSHSLVAAGLQHSLQNTLQVSDGRCNRNTIRNIIYYYIFLAAFLDFPWSRWRTSSTNTEAVGATIHTCLILLWVAITSFTMGKCAYHWYYNSQSPPLTQQLRRYYSWVLP